MVHWCEGNLRNRQKHQSLWVVIKDWISIFHMCFSYQLFCDGSVLIQAKKSEILVYDSRPKFQLFCDRSVLIQAKKSEIFVSVS